MSVMSGDTCTLKKYMHIACVIQIIVNVFRNVFAGCLMSFIIHPESCLLLEFERRLL